MDPKLQYLIIGLIVGVLATLLISTYSVNNQNYGMMQMMGMGRGVENMMAGDEQSHDDFVGMDAMVSELKGLSGEEFDRRFIELMIEHHEGAIDMAKLISTSTKREELQKMGEGIVDVQSTEIEMMRGWLNEWFN